MNKLIRRIRNNLITIPVFCQLGIIRKKILNCFTKPVYEVVSLEKVKEIYSVGANDSNDKYFIVYVQMPKGGLFVYLISCMSQIAHALHKGYIPVVDLLNFPSDLRNKCEENAWELYFEQPKGVSVQEVYGASNIVFHNEEEEKELYIGDIESGKSYDEFRVVINEGGKFEDWYQNEELMKSFKSFWNENIKYNKSVNDYIDKKYSEIIGEERSVLGLLCRGTDYVSLRPKGHYVQPTVQQIIEKVNEVLEEFKCKKIFLATEDLEILETLKEKFGTRLVYMDVPRVNYYEGVQLCDLYRKQKMNLFQRQLDYLTEMEILARLPYLIAGKTTGSRFIPVMKKGEFDYLYYWELGRY